MMEKLFNEFKPCSASEWKNQIVKDLKGAPYDELTWHNENGFDIEPFYTKESLADAYEPAFTHSGWEIAVEATGATDAEINAGLLKKLNEGAGSISVSLRQHDPEQVLKGVQLNHIRSVFFVDGKNAEKLLKYLEKTYDLNTLGCCIFPDQSAGRRELEYYFKIIKKLSPFKNISTISVNVLPYHNRQCTAAYEIALLFSILVEFLEATGEKELPASFFAMNVGVTADYFVQIAKLRAMRRLWKVFQKEYQVKNDLYIITNTSLTNKSLSDSYNNLLRTTVEAMAAVAGGCNELVVLPFDELFKVNPSLSARMAVNQQLILKEEVYLDKMADIGCGSYYIETLTDLLAEKALELFKGFEDEGGYFKCLEKNIFSRDIAIQSKLHDEALRNNQQVAVGINKFRNEKEKLKISPELVKQLRQLPVNNPLLNFELENFFDLKNA